MAIMVIGAEKHRKSLETGSQFFGLLAVALLPDCLHKQPHQPRADLVVTRALYYALCPIDQQPYLQFVEQSLYLLEFCLLLALTHPADQTLEVGHDEFLFEGVAAETDGDQFGNFEDVFVVAEGHQVVLDALEEFFGRTRQQVNSA